MSVRCRSSACGLAIRIVQANAKPQTEDRQTEDRQTEDLHAGHVGCTHPVPRNATEGVPYRQFHSKWVCSNPRSFPPNLAMVAAAERRAAGESASGDTK